MKVLILSSPDDAHARAVKKHLDDLNASVDFFRYEEFIQRCSLSFNLSNKGRSVDLKRLGESLPLSQYSGIWHRRPGYFLSNRFAEPWIEHMAEQESREAFDGLFCALDCVWMNHPRKDVHALYKLWQLELARQLGMSIPATIVTNNPEEAAQFFEDCSQRVIYKLIGEKTNFAIPSQETPRGISTLPLRKEDLPHLDQVRHCPHLFQECIEKQFELRVTVVGKEIFCIKIDSQAGIGKLDWRNDYSVDMQPYALPDDLSHKCLQLMRRLGLNYGALDFCVTPQGEYIFLEINCSGQYLWVEDKTDLEISRQIAKLLAGKAEPLVHPIPL